MTIQTPVTRAEDEAVWDAAADAANLWRGEMIQLFAQAEQAVSETLETLALDPVRGAKIQLRRLVGQRFEDLSLALSEHFNDMGEKAAKALANFRRHEHLRPTLCHGAAKLALDRNGHWLIILKLVDFRNRSVERKAETIEQREAEAMLGVLRSDAQNLRSALQSLRSRLVAAARK